MKTTLAVIAVLLLAACAASGDPAGSSTAPVTSEGGNVVDSQNSSVSTGKY